jgi:hypothetical protein
METENPIRIPFDPIDTKIPILRCYNNYKSLTYKEFKNWDLNNDLKYVINGRYPLNLIHNNSYFLVFNNTNGLNNYMNEVSNKEVKINETFLSFQPVFSLTDYLRFLYPIFMPDLEELPDLIRLSTHSVPKNTSKNEKHLRMQTIEQLLNNRTKAFDSSEFANVSSTLKGISSQLESILNTGNINYPTISRSNCVILRNIPHKINSYKLRDFFWDLDWHSDEEKQIRAIMTEKTTLFTIYVLVFENHSSALKCIQRSNGNHLFYDKSLPLVTAELL